MWPKERLWGGGRVRGEPLGEECAEGSGERVVSEGRRWDLEGKQVTLEVGKDSAAALPPLASAQSRSGSVPALPLARSAVSGCGVGSSSLPSFLPSFVTRPGQRRRRQQQQQQHEPAFARVGGCSL